MSFGDGNLREKVERLEAENGKLQAAVSGLWNDLSIVAPEIAEHWLNACPTVKVVVNERK